MQYALRIPDKTGAAALRFVGLEVKRPYPPALVILTTDGLVRSKISMLLASSSVLKCV